MTTPQAASKPKRPRLRQRPAIDAFRGATEELVRQTRSVDDVVVLTRQVSLSVMDARGVVERILRGVPDDDARGLVEATLLVRALESAERALDLALGRVDQARAEPDGGG